MIEKALKRNLSGWSVPALSIVLAATTWAADKNPAATQTATSVSPRKIAARKKVYAPVGRVERLDQAPDDSDSLY